MFNCSSVKLYCFAMSKQEYLNINDVRQQFKNQLMQFDKVDSPKMPGA